MKEIWAGLRDAPLWVLGGSALSALVAWLVAPLNAIVPATYRPYLPIASIVFLIFAGARALHAVTAAVGHRRARHRRMAQQRLRRLYRPMLGLFTEQHLASSEAILSPRLKHRIANAWRLLQTRRGLGRKTRAAWRALGDREVSASAEMEFGSTFPLAKIKGILSGALEFADADLMSLVRRADRSHYEDQPQDSEVTGAEYALMTHIFTEHHRLTSLAER